MERVKLNNTVDLKQLQKAHMKFGCFFHFGLERRAETSRRRTQHPIPDKRQDGYPRLDGGREKPKEVDKQADTASQQGGRQDRRKVQTRRTH